MQTEIIDGKEYVVPDFVSMEKPKSVKRDVTEKPKIIRRKRRPSRPEPLRMKRFRNIVEVPSGKRSKHR